MTSGFRGLREKWYIWRFYGVCCTRILASLLGVNPGLDWGPVYRNYLYRVMVGILGFFGAVGIPIDFI